MLSQLLEATGRAYPESLPLQVMHSHAAITYMTRATPYRFRVLTSSTMARCKSAPLTIGELA